jgi:hypothetical protein
MPRTPSPQIQLEFGATAPLRWEDLPAALRDRVREHVAALLWQAERRARAVPEAGDDE